VNRQPQEHEWRQQGERRAGWLVDELDDIVRVDSVAGGRRGNDHDRNDNAQQSHRRRVADYGRRVSDRGSYQLSS